MLGQRIAEARQARDLTASSLARMVGISRAAVAQWESGETEPSSRNLRKVAEAVGVTLEWLGQGKGAALGVLPNKNPLAEAERVDSQKLPPEQAKILTAAIGGRKAEIWRITSDVLSGAGYQSGDYLIVDNSTPTKPQSIVLATSNNIPLVRMYLPPWLYALRVPNSPQRPAIVVDNVSTIVKGVVIHRFTLA